LNPYSYNKALLHMDRLLELRDGKLPAPIHTHLIISDLCNQNCSFCAYRIDGYTEFFAIRNGSGKLVRNPNRMINYDTVIRILEELKSAGVKAVQFTGGGEPTLHPDCAEFINRAHQLKLDTALVTNGWKLNKEIRSAILGSTWIRISLDCASPESYHQMRRAPERAFHEVLENIRALVDARDKSGSDLTIGIGYVVNKDNWQEIIPGVKLARSLGVDNIRLSAVFQPENAAYFVGFHYQAAALCKEAEWLSTGEFKVINNFSDRMGELVQGHPEYSRCPHQHFVPYIGADLNLYCCCVLAYTRRGLIGSLKDQSFSELWWGEKRKDYLEAFDARECPRCQFNDKNRNMNKLIESSKIMHGNFL